MPTGLAAFLHQSALQADILYHLLAARRGETLLFKCPHVKFT